MFYSKLRNTNDRKALVQGLDLIRKEINRSPALVERFSAFETTDFTSLFDAEIDGLEEGELALSNRGLTPDQIFKWIRSFFGLDQKNEGG